MKRTLKALIPVLALCLIGFGATPPKKKGPYLANFTLVKTIATLPSTATSGTCSIAVVNKTIGNLVKDDVLVVTANNTIEEVSPTGTVTTFATLNTATTGKAVGLTGSIVALKSGWVIVTSVPMTAGIPDTDVGDIFVLNSMGSLVLTITGLDVEGPFAVAVAERVKKAALFVATAGRELKTSTGVIENGRILRIELNTPKDNGTNAPKEIRRRVILTGFAESFDTTAGFKGVNGLVFHTPSGRLFFIDTATDEIFAVNRALRTPAGTFRAKRIHRGGLLSTPQAVVISPNKSLIVTNALNGEIAEFALTGRELFHESLTTTAGALCGLAIAPKGAGIYFINDATHTLDLLYH